MDAEVEPSEAAAAPAAAAAELVPTEVDTVVEVEGVSDEEAGVDDEEAGVSDDEDGVEPEELQMTPQKFIDVITINTRFCCQEARHVLQTSCRQRLPQSCPRVGLAGSNQDLINHGHGAH